MDLRGKTALVTGAAQGIGATVARSLAAAGAAVAAVDASAEGLGTLEAQLTAAGHRVAIFPADVSDGQQVEAAVASTEQHLGPIDLLAHVAGIVHLGPVVTLADEDWRRVFAVNTEGVFQVCRAVARRMLPRRRGSIVTVASNAARTPRLHMAAYAASKAAAAMFTRCLGLELAPHNIRCNVVSPGSTDTPMQRSLWTASDGARPVIEGLPAAFRLGIPLGRLATPGDVAEAVLFLLSDRAAHITMHDLCVDGGATLGGA